MPHSPETICFPSVCGVLSALPNVALPLSLTRSRANATRPSNNKVQIAASTPNARRAGHSRIVCHFHAPPAQLLSKIRWGQCTPEVLAELRGCSVANGNNNSSTGGALSQRIEDGIEKTQLLTHKADVLRVNEEVRYPVWP